MSTRAGASTLERKARAQSRRHGEWIEAMARLGYAAKGLLYLAVGGVAARAAFGADQPEGAKGAVSRLLENAVGAVIAGVIVAGLLGYASWRLVRAVANPENDGIGSRIYSVFTALLHVGILVSIVDVMFGASDNGDQAPHWTAQALAQPFGRSIVLAIGAALVANGVWQVYKALTTRIDDELEFGRMRRGLRRLTVTAARAGMSARGVVFALIGGSVGLAAWRSDPSEANGVQRALTAIAGERYGQTMLGALAAGFLAYGVYELVRAHYRRIRTG